MSEESRLKMSLAKKGKPSPRKGKPSPRKGKPISEEARENMKNQKLYDILCIETGEVFSSAIAALDTKNLEGTRKEFLRKVRAEEEYQGFHWKYIPKKSSK